MESKPTKPDSGRTIPLQPRLSQRILRLDAEVLFRDSSEVEIVQSGDIYRLRRTRMGKLILTK